MQPAFDASIAPRRRFVALLGGGAVLAAAPALGGCGSGLPARALQAWQPTDTIDVRRFMLAHALLAPNPHNRQPWLADLRREGEITLVCDPDRLLPETDPFGRQIVIGCGAFIELAVIAAAERGVRVRVDAFPDGEPAADQLPGGRVVARLLLQPDVSVASDPLFAQIVRRHTNKTAYHHGRAVPPAVWQQWQQTAAALGLKAGMVTDASRMQRLREITRMAYEREMTTPRTWLESAHLLRIGPSEIAKHRDGISIMGAMPRMASALGLFDRFEVPVRGSSNFDRVMARWPDFETGSGYFWLASQGKGRGSQLDAGRAYVRAHLQATAAGVDMHPLSQALQEFAEVRGEYVALHELVGFDSQKGVVQMLARVGYAVEAAGPAPRRELAALLRE